MARSPTGLCIKERDGYYWLSGTVQTASGPRSYRGSTRIRIGGTDARRLAERQKSEVTRRLIDEGELPQRVSITFAEAVADYIAARKARRRHNPLTVHQPDTNILAIGEVLEWFAAEKLADRPIDQIAAKDLNRYFLAHPAWAPSTKHRQWNIIRAVFNRARHQGAIDRIPRPDLPQPPNAASPVNKWLAPEEIELFLAFAPRHAKPLLAVLFATGRRVGSLLWLTKDAACLVEGHEYLLLGFTKNGEPDAAALPAYAANLLRAWLASRKDDGNDPNELFLTHRGLPYNVPKQKAGGTIKTMFNSVRAKVVKKLIDDGNHERARVVAKATPHWATHNAASHLMMKGHSNGQIKKFMAWKSIAMVDRYSHLAPGAERTMAQMLDFRPEAVAAAASVVMKKPKRRTTDSCTIAVRSADPNSN